MLNRVLVSAIVLCSACDSSESEPDASEMDVGTERLLSDAGDAFEPDSGLPDAGDSDAGADAGGDMGIPPVEGPARAFPGAEGAGTDVITGGRMGEVVHVTTLAANGAGSLAEAVSGSDRFIVFDVCGIIDMAGETLRITGNNITIAGETAPGGISLFNTRVLMRDQSNIVIRFLRVREVPPDLDGMLVWHSREVVIDHCSIAGASDETLSVTGTSADVTLSWIAMEESHNEPEFHSDSNMHNYGSILSVTEPASIDLHHSLYIHQGKRCPLVGGRASVQSVNNIIYNWANDEQKFAADVHDPALFHLVGNYFISGADTRLRSVAEPIRGMYYFDDNVWVDRRDTTHTDGAEFGTAQTPLDTPLFVGAEITTVSAVQALDDVAARVGALPRDATSRRMIMELETRTGTQGVEISSDDNTLACVEPPMDSDGDGLPDAWEMSAGLDPMDASDAMAMDASGYANIELYTHHLSSQLIAGDVSPW